MKTISEFVLVLYFIFEYAYSQDFGQISQQNQDFGYDGNTGPDFWGQMYNHECSNGKLQSPIDIEEKDVTIVHYSPIIFQNFDTPLETIKLQNNGHTVVFSIVNGTFPLVYGGPLKSAYNFSQLHFHWGRTDDEGSENQINNHSFPLELHMVFYKADYENFKASVDHPDGLIVLSFLYEKSDEDNENYSAFTENLPAIQEVGSTVEIDDFVSLDSFSTTDRYEYFLYTGSLTTPPCSEAVTWIEFRKTISLSHKQIQKFRLISGTNGILDHNFRPIQPLHDRTIYLNLPEN
ncbi:unnamed protein product [Phaedon cochleariae]|uniref:Carbonic anhydrase n=1 Tax=Phaedon cochleariae TaxID=80249 RepID=A0A9P0GPR6_PHACE|nr:unnamed protein product [Phaedon cochleariae]